MPDVMMEGINALGTAAQLLLLQGDAVQVASLLQNLEQIATTSIASGESRAVCTTVVSQLADIQWTLLVGQVDNPDHVNAVLQRHLTTIVKAVIQMPDSPFGFLHTSALAAYYSTTSFQSLLSRLTGAVSTLSQLPESDETARRCIHNISKWAKDLWKQQRELVILAVTLRSAITFDLLHWVKCIATLLLAVSRAPACDGRTAKELRKAAKWLIATIYWIPKDQESVRFVEAYRITELLFDAALEAHHEQCQEEAREVQSLLLNWACIAGAHDTGWNILEDSLFGLAILATMGAGSLTTEQLINDLRKLLKANGAPTPERRLRAAQTLREVATRRQRGFPLSRMEYTISQVDAATLRKVLDNIADELSSVPPNP